MKEPYKTSQENSPKIWWYTEKAVSLQPRLSYGVMVAQQVLVLFVVVRIRVRQQ